MKIAFASDLHFEFDESRIHHLIKQVDPDTDVLILAGDIQEFNRLIIDLEFVSKALPDIHIVYVTGNHEFYGYRIEDVEKFLRDAFDHHPRIHYLEKKSFELNGVVFLGTTLWTGFDAYPYYEQSRSEENAMHGISDFMYIRCGTGKFQSYHCKKLFKENCAWLSNTLEINNRESKISIVVTHFPPSPSVYHEKIPINSLSNYFQADCRDIINQYQPAYWIYGHNHWSDRQEMDETIVVSNQLGYPNEFCQTESLLEYIVIENDSND